MQHLIVVNNIHCGIKKILYAVIFVMLSAINAWSQIIHTIKADSVLVNNEPGNGELNLESSTKDTLGFLYNKGNGRTQFRRGLIKINDTLYRIGSDTLNIAKGWNSSSYIRNQKAFAQTANAWVTGTFRADTFKTSRITITDDNANIEIDVTISGSMRSNYGSNGRAFHDFTNGIIRVNRTASEKGGKLAMFSQTSTNMGYVAIGNQYQNSQYSSTLGTVNSYFIGTLSYDTFGVASANNNIYGINLNFSNQLSANNPNAAWFQTSDDELPLIIKKTGQLISNKMSAGSTTGDALLQLAAGTSSANSAPLKFTSGANLTTPENGAVEYDGTNYYATSNSARFTLAKTLTTTSVLNFGTTSAGSSTDLTITLTGAVNGDAVSLGVPNEAMFTNGVFSAWVSTANTVTVRFSNNDLSNAIDPASGTFRISILKY